MPTTLKAQLADFNAQQKIAFAQGEVIPLLRQRSDFYDQCLITRWQQAGLAAREDLTLIAVGGYGRQEMFPLSDLDILILCEQPLDEPTQHQINQLINTLWDSKLQVGASVRTLAECLTIGKAELSVATNMLEGRFLLGNRAQWQTLMTQLYQPDFWDIHTFFTAKMAEKQARYARYHNTSYNLEPDLKHSPGGLRDLHLLSWIMLRQYGVQRLDQLRAKGLIFPAEYHALQDAQALLFRMRFGLHLQLKRYDNRLRFDRQLQLSEQLGYLGEGNQPVETMMKAFFQATQTISQLSELLLASFAQDVLTPLQKQGEMQPLDRHFVRQDQQIHCPDPLIFSQQPDTILDLFWHLTQHPDTQIAPTTLRHLRLALQQLRSPLCDHPQARQRFIQMFHQPDCVRRAVVPMHRFGVLSAYLPQWQAIAGRMQFDLFHIYTVDEHTVRVMSQLEHFLSPSSQAEFPLCHRLIQHVPSLARLLLAALFHDIGKGRDGDHATLGAEDMRHFAEQHGFSAEESEEMAWLVAEHLTMSITAQRRDIHDPEIVKGFAETVQQPTALAALTCLTVADICATNETLWNDWKRSLFHKLHQFTLTQLALGEDRLDYRKLGQQHRQDALEQMKFLLSATEQTALSAFWHACPADYFVRHSPTQLVWHALHYLRQPQQSPMVLVSNQYARGATEMFVYCADQPQLFARLAHTLSQKKVTIHDAQVLTSEHGFALDSFIITESGGQPLNAERCQQIQTALQRTIQHDHRMAFKPSRKPLKHHAFKAQTQVRFLANSQPNQTAFELFTLDREGLLAQIGYIFSQQQLTLLNAKITTIGEKVEDFFVVSQHDTALSAAAQTALQQRLLTELTGEGE